MTSLLMPPRSIRSVHRDQVLKAFQDTAKRRPDTAALLDEALTRVARRLDRLPWSRDSLQPLRPKAGRQAIQHGDVPMICHDAVERAIVYALARTWPSAQFSVDLNGLIFAGLLNGYHHKSDRLYVSGLSKIIDEAGELLNSARCGAGGRFYVRDDDVQMADGHSVLATLRLLN